MNPWLAFFIGIFIGEFSMLFIIAIFQASGEDRKCDHKHTSEYMLGRQ